jgi:hypothetical protein
MRWVLAAHLVSAFLYVVSAALVRPDTRLLIGYWYNDSHRLAAMLPITAVPLAVAGVVFLAGKLEPLVRHERATVPVLAAVLTVALAVLTAGLYPTDREARVAVTYRLPDDQKLVTDRMRAFYDRIAGEIPKDAVVIGNPFDGSVMLWALADRRVLYPHFLSAKSKEEEYLGRHLSEAAHNPRVCKAIRHYHVEYVLIGKTDRALARTVPFEGIAGVSHAAGFELTDHSGQTSLYRVTACD